MHRGRVRRRPDPPSLAAGVVLTGFGALLLLDALSVLDLSFAALAPIACAAVGAILVVSGLTRGRG
jgi:hypothetical protein